MRWLRWLRWTLIGVAALAGLAFAGAWWAMHRSLPRIDGELSAAGLAAEATIERDARGVPVIGAGSRADLAFATGFAHAQDRFFQMDLSRRLAAGELSELFGAVALKQDMRARRFGFRGVARRVVEGAPAAERAVIEAYARGVNAGLSGLDAPTLGIPVAARRRRGLGCRRIRCWWCTRCGGSCNTAPSTRKSGGAASSARRPREARRRRSQLLGFVYAGHSGWDTPNYSADARCVQAACTESARVLTRRSRRCCDSCAPAEARCARAAQAGQQQLGGGGHAHEIRRRAHRQRHAPRHRRARGLVPGAPARHR